MTRRRNVLFAGLALALVGLGAWGVRSWRAAREQASPVVARFEGGTVSAADVDAAILDLPPQRRQPEDGDYLKWYERIARELAFSRVLLEEAGRAGGDPLREFPQLAAEARKLATVSLFLERELPPARPPSPAQVEAFYQAHRAEFVVPEGRSVTYFFRRVEPGQDSRAALADVAEIRRRVVAGGDLATLAARASDSETRHERGALGWVGRGQLDRQLEDLIFSLEVGVPSRPVETAQGVHLFLVTAERPAKSFSLDELRPAIAQRLAGEEREAALFKLVSPELPPDSFVPDDEQLRGLLEGGDPSARAFKIGELELSLGELQQRLAIAASLMPKTGTLSLRAFVESLRQRELVYRHCAAHRLDRGPEVERRARRVLDRELALRLVRRRLSEALEQDSARLEQYYETNQARFSAPLRLHLERLAVPLGPQADRAMARLERLAREPPSAGALQAAASELGGQVEDLGWQTVGQLALRGSRAAGFAPGLRAGEVSPPWRTATHLELVRLLERQEPQALPFEEVRARVRDDYLAQHAQEQYAERQEEALRRAGFRLDRERLEALLLRPPV